MINFSYWLVPAEPVRTELLGLIQQLSNRFKAVEFEPHVTVHVGPSHDKEIDLNVDMIANTFAPLTLSPRSLQFSQVLTKTLFTQFDSSSELQAMSDLIRQHSEISGNYQLNPHMSLLYQLLSDEVLSKLATTTTTPGGPYRFDTLQVIAAATR